MKDTVMTCNQIRELMPDLAAGLTAVTPEMKGHLQACTECSGKLEAFRQTMKLMDEWRVPEASPYFDVRLRARLREEQTRQSAGRLQWLRRPALAVSFAVLVAVGVTLFPKGETGQPVSQVIIVAEPGTAVGDLQALDKNHELYSDFDVLDDLQVQQDVNANP
jgi:predicted anti-sigma-YlaC factor YlaD